MGSGEDDSEGWVCCQLLLQSMITVRGCVDRVRSMVWRQCCQIAAAHLLNDGRLHNLLSSEHRDMCARVC